MKLSPQEKAARKAAFHALSPGKKLEYIFTYYKWPILLGLIALLVLGSVLKRELTKKEPVLYLAMANVVAGDELEGGLTRGYLRFAGLDEKRREVYLYRELYLSEDADVLNHEYAYASGMKLMGAIQAGKLDLALMNREAYDLLSRRGWLQELGDLPAGAEPWLQENEVVLSDNAIEWQLGEAESREVLTETARNALQVDQLPLFRAAGITEPLYLGVIANSSRSAAALDYIRYLLEEPS